jgi:hypothetical protein
VAHALEEHSQLDARIWPSPSVSNLRKTHSISISSCSRGGGAALGDGAGEEEEVVVVGGGALAVEDWGGEDGPARKLLLLLSAPTPAARLPLREKKERTLPMAMVPGSGVVVARAREGEGDVAGGRDHMAVRHRLRRGPPLVQECQAAGDAEHDAVPCRKSEMERLSSAASQMSKITDLERGRRR